MSVSSVRGIPFAGPVPAAGAASRAGTLTNVQALRAAAALAVLLYHASVYVGRARGPSALDVFGPGFGLMGVAVFFAISGFLMARLVRETPPWTFLAHRVLRIFPAYLAFAVLFAALSPLFGLGIGLKLLALTLAPAGPRAYPLGIEWTLLFETTFYVALFGIAVAGLARRLEWIAAGWLALVLGLWLAVPAAIEGLIVAPVHLILLSPANVPFAGGLLLPWLIERRLLPRAVALLALPLALACTASTLDAGRWLGGIAAVLLVAGAVQTEQIHARSRAARWVLKLGDWSYVVYLVHVPVMLIVVSLAPRTLPGPVLWALCAAAALVVACLFGPLELALYRRLRSWSDHASPARTRVLGLVYLAVFAVAAGVGSAQSARDDRRQALDDRLFAVEPSPVTGAAALPGPVRGALENVVVTADGVFLKAWAVAVGAPNADLSLGAFCDGRPIGHRRVSHRRPDVAVPDVAIPKDARIGFTVPLKADGCGAGDTIRAFVADGEGRIAPLPGTVLFPVTPSRP